MNTPSLYHRVMMWRNLNRNVLSQPGPYLKLARCFCTSLTCKTDKTKLPGDGSGSKTGDELQVDQDGYSVDLVDEKSQQNLEKFKQIIEKNTYYDKYKSKIIETQKSSPKSFLGIIQHLVAGKKAPEYESRKMQVRSKNSLNEVMKLEMLLKVDRDDIIFIWQEYHHSLNVLAATMTGQVYDRICTRGKLYSTFVLPLPKKDGYQMLLVQYFTGSFYFTPLIQYQIHKENAPVCLSLIHYTELRENKDLVLMRGELDKDILSLKEAQFLAVQLNLYYGEANTQRLDALKVFNENSSLFEHVDVIEELRRMCTEYAHLFPDLN